MVEHHPRVQDQNSNTVKVGRRRNTAADHGKMSASGSNPPPRTKFFTHERLGLPECPYLERWVLNFRWFSIRLHHWMGSDDKRNLHDHPWWFWSLVLWGSLTDVSEKGRTHRRPGSVAFFPAEYRHSVEIPKRCWTLLVTGPQTRVWGFWVNGKFRKRNKYFYMYGHHGCDQE